MLADGVHALVYPLLPTIAADLQLSYAQAGLVRAAFNTAGAALQLPAGILADRFGEYLVLTLGNAWLAAGLVGMALTGTFLGLLVMALVGGLGGNAQHPVGTSLVSKVYDGPGRGRAIGTVNFSGDLGKVVAPPLAGLLTVGFGWRVALTVSGAVALVMVLALWFTGRRTMVYSRGRAGPASASTEWDETEPELAEQAAARRSPVPAAAPADPAGARPTGSSLAPSRALASLVGIGVLDSSVRGATLTLLPFVLDAKGLPVEAIAGLYTVIFLGGAAGKFVCGAIIERFGTLPMIWATEALTAVGALLFLVAPVPALVPLALVFGFALNGTSSVLYAAVATLVGPERRSRVFGLYYTATIGASALAPVLYGAIGDRIGLLPAFAVAAAVTAGIFPLSLASRKHLVGSY